jgi:hypothetical protein
MMGSGTVTLLFAAIRLPVHPATEGEEVSGIDTNRLAQGNRFDQEEP